MTTYSVNRQNWTKPLVECYIPWATGYMYYSVMSVDTGSKFVLFSFGATSATIDKVHFYFISSSRPQTMPGYAPHGTMELAFTQDPATCGTSGQFVSSTHTGADLQKFCDAETGGTTKSISTSSLPISSVPNFNPVTKRFFFNPPWYYVYVVLPRMFAATLYQYVCSVV